MNMPHLDICAELFVHTVHIAEPCVCLCVQGVPGLVQLCAHMCLSCVCLGVGAAVCMGMCMLMFVVVCVDAYIYLCEYF